MKNDSANWKARSTAIPGNLFCARARACTAHNRFLRANKCHQSAFIMAFRRWLIAYNFSQTKWAVKALKSRPQALRDETQRRLKMGAKAHGWSAWACRNMENFVSGAFRPISFQLNFMPVAEMCNLTPTTIWSFALAQSLTHNEQLWVFCCFLLQINFCVMSSALSAWRKAFETSSA